jgi:hypothetical protein
MQLLIDQLNEFGTKGRRCERSVAIQTLFDI